MEHGISRKDDESLYQPKIHSQRVRALYSLKQATGKPMTVLLDKAICDLADRYQSNPHLDEPALENAPEETWEEIQEYRGLLDRLDYERCLEELGKIKSNEQGRNTTN